MHVDRLDQTWAKPVVERRKSGRVVARQFVLEGLVDLVGLERFALMFRVSGLSARLAFFSTPLGCGLGWFNDIAGRRLGGVGRILSRLGKLGFKLFDPFGQRLIMLQQHLDRRGLFGHESFESFDFSVLGVHASDCHK